MVSGQSGQWLVSGRSMSPTQPCSSGGHWSLVSGQWSLVSGHWSVVTGQWSLVSGHWSVVTGQWSVELVSGQWSRSVAGHDIDLPHSFGGRRSSLIIRRCPSKPRAT